ncbi:hypothetical protein [Vaccinia virus]|uniref:Uncharacterized protein n=1 Tax=Vaccinia virus TaxID=10245 RepID=A0A2I6J121_VACCV|nr:hypothetical protein [Vaccinia virus]
MFIFLGVGRLASMEDDFLDPLFNIFDLNGMQNPIVKQPTIKMILFFTFYNFTI